MDDRVEFNIGWDYAAYGMPVPDEASDSLRAGHAAGLHKFRRPIGEADRYVRKWLQLRRNAAKRYRIFEDNVTPDWLRVIDVQVCPVTWEVLTHGTRSGTDWSVDRIVNDGSYARDNLAVMSTLANQAKSNKNIDDICELAYQDGAADGLSAQEWYRLATFVVGTYERAGLVWMGKYMFPYSPHIPSHMYLSMLQRLQEAIMQKVFGCRGQEHFIRQITAMIKKYKADRTLHKLEKRMRKVYTTRASAGYVMMDRQAFAIFGEMVKEMRACSTANRPFNNPASWEDVLTPDMESFRRDISMESRGFAV